MHNFNGELNDHRKNSNEPPEDSSGGQGPLPSRFIKIILYGFLLVILGVMLFLKPYLPSAILHNFADIDDYRIFPNRVVRAQAPGQPWPVAKTEHAPPDAATQALLDRLKTTALVMIDHGQIAYERYSLSGGRDVISGSFSMAKSIVSLLLGFALQEHAIKSLDEPISNYFTVWAAIPQGNITIRQLLTMSSGLDWNESYSNPFSITTEAYYGSDLYLTTMRQAQLRDPGTRFEYQSGTSQLLGFIVSKAVDKTLSQYASEKLWIPLGAQKDALWSLDHDEGMEKAYCCFNATALDFARIGQFMLQNGQWQGKQLLNADYLKEITTPNRIPDDSGKPVDYYGEQWWIYQSPEGPIPYARGILGQYIIVIPQRDRVIVRLGMKRAKSVGHHPAEVGALVKWGLE